MIVGLFHAGNGLGDQLFRYITTRSIAADKGLEFGMINPQGFKGSSFMNIDMGLPVPVKYTIEQPSGKAYFEAEDFKLWEETAVYENGVDIRSYDPEINFIEDNTIIDGSFEDEKYWGHHLFEINRWLNVETQWMPDDVCIIGFSLLLPTSYYQEAMDEMLKINYNMKFVCVTDDPETARRVLPEEVKITHDLQADWRQVRNASYLIIPNSAFYVLPALLNRNVKKAIAPRGWTRYNLHDGTWARPASYYRKFSYI